MTDKAIVTAKVLKWARESAKMTEEIASSKVTVSVEKLREWESGGSYPTIKQAQQLAHEYRRSFALFFLPEIPDDFQPLQDFRRKGSKSLSTSSVFIIREIQQKQAWISDENKENNEEKAQFVGRFSQKDDPAIIANDILRTLNINPLSYQKANPIHEWIEKAELNGIFISRTSFIHSRLTLDSEELQGFAIADEYAPFVFINSDDWNAPQLFTLVHELAHIWIAETGISNNIDPVIEKEDDFNPVELFCNRITANALMPDEYVKNLGPQSFANARSVFKSAKVIGVSSFALLIRALNLKIIPIDYYYKLKSEADQEYKDFLLREEEKKNKLKGKMGGPDYYLLQLNRNSRLFTQTILDAYKGGLIEPTQASNLLNVKVNNFPKLEAQMYR
jgi:Zn-dependent peptidase ImmA (M78 family)